jgi:hypothetical protein
VADGIATSRKWPLETRMTAAFVPGAILSTRRHRSFMICAVGRSRARASSVRCWIDSRTLVAVMSVRTQTVLTSPPLCVDAMIGLTATDSQRGCPLLSGTSASLRSGRPAASGASNDGICAGRALIGMSRSCQRRPPPDAARSRADA